MGVVSTVVPVLQECQECNAKFAWYVRNEGLCRRCRELAFHKLRSACCLVCGFAEVELAHIIPRRSPLSDMLNAKDNLIPLCPNHHTLFDKFSLPGNESSKLFGALRPFQQHLFVVLIGGDYPKDEEGMGSYCVDCFTDYEDCECWCDKCDTLLVECGC